MAQRLTKRQRRERAAELAVKPADELMVAPKSKPGRKPKLSKPESKTEAPSSNIEIARLKDAVIGLLGMGVVKTPTVAARKLGINPTRVHSWLRHDPEFAEQVKLTQEVLADNLEEKLIASNNVIAEIFLLKGYRPKFRDNYRFVEIKDESTKRLLQELRELGSKPSSEPLPGAKPIEVPNPFMETIKRIESTERQIALPLVEEANEASQPGS